MRNLLLIISCLLTSSLFGQSLSDKYLHFRTDYYWDTTLYKSEQDFYYENNNGQIIRNKYPVLEYLFTNVIAYSPFLVGIDTFERRYISGEPYKYIRKGKRIYLQFFDAGEKKLRLHKEYIFDKRDTVKNLVQKNTLNISGSGPSVGGSSIYLGEETITINGKSFNTFKFREDYASGAGSHAWSRSEVIFLDQSALIPVKIVQTSYYSTTRENPLYNAVTWLASSSNTLPDYTDTKSDDLILYENKDINWTEKQKQAFMKTFLPDRKEYGECVLKKLDGHISFFLFQFNNYFRRLMSKDKCE